MGPRTPGATLDHADLGSGLLRNFAHAGTFQHGTAAELDTLLSEDEHARNWRLNEAALAAGEAKEHFNLVGDDAATAAAQPEHITPLTPEQQAALEEQQRRDEWEAQLRFMFDEHTVDEGEDVQVQPGISLEPSVWDKSAEFHYKQEYQNFRNQIHMSTCGRYNCTRPPVPLKYQRSTFTATAKALYGQHAAFQHPEGKKTPWSEPLMKCGVVAFMDTGACDGRLIDEMFVKYGYGEFVAFSWYWGDDQALRDETNSTRAMDFLIDESTNHPDRFFAKFPRTWVHIRGGSPADYTDKIAALRDLKHTPAYRDRNCTTVTFMDWCKSNRFYSYQLNKVIRKKEKLKSRVEEEDQIGLPREEWEGEGAAAREARLKAEAAAIHITEEEEADLEALLHKTAVKLQNSQIHAALLHFGNNLPRPMHDIGALDSMKLLMESVDFVVNTDRLDETFILLHFTTGMKFQLAAKLLIKMSMRQRREELEGLVRGPWSEAVHSTLHAVANRAVLDQTAYELAEEYFNTALSQHVLERQLLIGKVHNSFPGTKIWYTSPNQ